MISLFMKKPLNNSVLDTRASYKKWDLRFMFKCHMYGKLFYYFFSQISYIVYKISSLINEISTLFYRISIIKKISYIANKISVLLY